MAKLKTRGIQEQGAWGRVSLAASLHQPRCYGCRRQASGRGPGGSFGVPPSAGPPWRAPPPGSRGDALSASWSRKENLRGCRTTKCPGQCVRCCVPLPWDGGLTLPPWGPPSSRSHQVAAIGLGFQRAVGWHEDGVGSGSLDLGYQPVALGAGAGVTDGHDGPQS